MKGIAGDWRDDWTLVCHIDDGWQGGVAVLKENSGHLAVHQIPTTPGSGKPSERRPVFLGIDDDNKVVLLDPESREITVQDGFPVDAFPAYAYRDKESSRIWFMKDGDSKTGNDVLNCGDQGSSVTVINPVVSGDGGAEFIKTICVGRGHHVTTFVAPSQQFPEMQRRAFVSNLVDGSISVLGNDPDDDATYLKVIDTINLCEKEKQDDGEMSIPNNAFPHGKEYSPFTGRIYSLNNGYATVAVINPVNHDIEDRIELKVSSNLLLSPDGRFLIGKGADRKSDPDHVMGRLSVIDAQARKVVGTLDLPDIYPSVYRFSPDGGRLYVTTAATGKAAQHDNLKIDCLQIYDTSALPAIRLIKEVKVGSADCGRRPIAFYAREGELMRVFVPNPTDGTMTVLDGDDNVIDTVKISDGAVKEVNFSFWQGDTYGA